MKQQARMRVVVPALLILLVFLVGFPVWVRSPHSVGGRLFAYAFGAVLIILAIVGVIGRIALFIYGWRVFRD